MPVLHAASGYTLLLQFQGHWQIPSWPGPSTGLIIRICQLISMGKGRKTPWALFICPDLVDVPFAAPGPWRNLCPSCVCLCLLWKLPLAHTYKSAKEPLLISNSSTGCTERRLSRAETIWEVRDLHLRVNIRGILTTQRAQVIGPSHQELAVCPGLCSWFPMCHPI